MTRIRGRWLDGLLSSASRRVDSLRLVLLPPPCSPRALRCPDRRRRYQAPRDARCPDLLRSAHHRDRPRRHRHRPRCGAAITWAGGWGRVYFLAFLNPSQGQPDPALTARLASLGLSSELARRRRSNEKVPLTWKNRACLETYQPRVEGTFPVKNSARTARVMVSADGRGLVSQAGAVLLWETMRVTGLGRVCRRAWDRRRAPRATSPPREELSRNSVLLDEAGPRPRGTSSQGRLNELTECQT
jgi:hypothetical protein